MSFARGRGQCLGVAYMDAPNRWRSQVPPGVLARRSAKPLASLPRMGRRTPAMRHVTAHGLVGKLPREIPLSAAASTDR